jgi:hypothetical protein
LAEICVLSGYRERVALNEMGTRLRLGTERARVLLHVEAHTHDRRIRRDIFDFLDKEAHTLLEKEFSLSFALTSRKRYAGTLRTITKRSRHANGAGTLHASKGLCLTR